MTAFVGPGGAGNAPPPINIPPYPVAHPANSAVRMITNAPLVNANETAVQLVADPVIWLLGGHNPTAEPLYFQLWEGGSFAGTANGSTLKFTYGVPRRESVRLPFMPGLPGTGLTGQPLYIAWSREVYDYVAGPTTPPDPFVSWWGVFSQVP